MELSDFVNIGILDNFYQTSSFIPMPVVSISTSAESGFLGHGYNCIDVKIHWNPMDQKMFKKLFIFFLIIFFIKLKIWFLLLDKIT